MSRAICMFFLLSAVLGIFTGWILMLAIGIVHAEVLPDVRPVGYDFSYVLSVLGAIWFGFRGKIEYS